MGIKSRIKSILGKQEEVGAVNVPPTTQLSLAAAQLDSIPRYTSGVMNFLENKLEFTDSTSTKFIIGELFDIGIYEFKTESKQPYIIDCGANIGLSIIYFKKLFPLAEVIGFEPDANVFQVLSSNMKSFGLGAVELYQKALWSSDKQLTFYSEGADAGRVEQNENAATVQIDAVRLSPFLQRKVDFLKIDIEGAELEVLEECAASLQNVERIFVEYHSFVGKPQRLARLIEILEDAGFRLSINTPGLVSVKPFVHLKKYNGMDMQLNIYAFRS